MKSAKRRLNALLSFDKGDFTWYYSVKGYEWVESFGATIYRIGASHDGPWKEKSYSPPYLVPVSVDPLLGGVYQYRVYQVPSNLFLAFAETEPEQYEIFRFAVNYGTLTYFDERGNSSDFAPPGEPLEFWEREILDMFYCVRLWEGYTEGKEEVVKDLLFKEGLLKEDGSEDPFEKAKEFVSSVLWRKFTEYPLKLVLDPLEEQTPAYFFPSNLISAMWYQLYLWVIGKKRYRRCAVCGKWEDITNRRSDWSAHPECALKVRAQRYREKRKKEVADRETPGKE